MEFFPLSTSFEASLNMLATLQHQIYPRVFIEIFDETLGPIYFKRFKEDFKGNLLVFFQGLSVEEQKNIYTYIVQNWARLTYMPRCY